MPPMDIQEEMESRMLARAKDKRRKGQHDLHRTRLAVKAMRGAVELVDIDYAEAMLLVDDAMATLDGDKDATLRLECR